MSLTPETPVEYHVDATQQVIPVDGWIKVVDRLSRNRPIRFSVLHNASFRHPWNLGVRWNSALERWEVQIEPGFVNGLDATISMNAADAPFETLERVLEETGSYPKGRISALLTESPFVPLRPENWRSIGGEGGTESIPEFFKVMGVREPEKTNAEFQVVQEGLAGARPPERRLMAQDVSLSIGRPSLVADLTRDPSGLDLLNFNVLPAPGDGRAQVTVSRKHSPATPATLSGQVLAGEVDEPFDRLKLGTIYMLSGDASSGVPEFGWTPFPRHDVFWNLNHAVESDLSASVNLRTGTALFPGLFGGPLIESIQQGRQPDAEFLSLAINTSSIEGRFWIV